MARITPNEMDTTPLSQTTLTDPASNTITRRYFRVRYTNGSVNQGYFRLQSLLGTQAQLTSALNSTIQTDADALITRSVLVGSTDGWDYVNVPVTPEWHLEVAVHSPLLPFGSLHTENLIPVMQTDCVYGLNEWQNTSGSTLSWSVSDTGGMFSVSTGTTIYAQAFIQWRKRLRYRPGQWVVWRFTALYTTWVADSYQVVWFWHAESGVYFGYVWTSFGILYVSTWIRETQTLTVATWATAAGNLTITLNSVAFTVPVTNASNIYRTAYEIATFTYAGWKTTQVWATVVFVADAAWNKAGTFSIWVAATWTAASITETLAWVASTDTFIPQSSWNWDICDWTWLSWFTLDPTKWNVFQIWIQYLWFGHLKFEIEAATPNNNNVTFITVHTIKIPNTLTTPSFRNPSFPFSMAVYSAGSTTNVTCKSASYAGFIEGQKALMWNRFSYFNQLTTVWATNFQALMTVQNTRYYKWKANQAVINLLSVSWAIKHTSPVIYYLIKNWTLAGNPNFVVLSTDSCSVWDTAATTVTYTNWNQLLWTWHIWDTWQIDHHFWNGAYNAEEVTLQPWEWVTLAAKATTWTPSYVTGAINTREDQ